MPRCQASKKEIIDSIDIHVFLSVTIIKVKFHISLNGRSSFNKTQIHVVRLVKDVYLVAPYS